MGAISAVSAEDISQVADGLEMADSLSVDYADSASDLQVDDSLEKTSSDVLTSDGGKTFNDLLNDIKEGPEGDLDIVSDYKFNNQFYFHTFYFLFF